LHLSDGNTICVRETFFCIDIDPDYRLVFLAMTFIGIWVVVFLLPETKGLALEEIGALFGDEVALDLSHLTLEQREALDKKLLDVRVDNAQADIFLEEGKVAE
jgi:hypothetical protein